MGDRTTYKPERMLAFSDAVMAVAITLLALDLKIPEGVSDDALAATLLGSGHSIGVYALSFVVIGLFWMGHQESFSHIKRVDGTLMWLNLFFLMSIGLIPFVTSILSDHSGAAGTICYACVLIVTSLLSAAAWWYARRDPQLVPADLPAAVRREGLLAPLLTAAIFAISIPIAMLSPSAAQWSWLLLLLAAPAAKMLEN